MGRRNWVGILLAGCTALSFGNVAKADTLADALVGAYNTSGLLEQNRAVLRAADEDVAQAVAALRPVLNWSADVTRSYGRSGTTTGTVVGFADNEANIGLTAELTLYDFGATKLNIDAAKEAVLATREALVGVEQEVLLRAVSAFFEVRRASQDVELRQSNLRLITRELRAARDRFDVGEVTRTDVSLAEARLAAARAALAASQGSLAVAQQEYAAVVGRKHTGPLQAPRSRPSLPGSVDQAMSVAVRNHPDLKAAQHQVTVAELNIAIAQAAMKPTVSLSGRYGLSDDLDSDAYTAGGSVSLSAQGPIYQGGRLSSLVRQSMANRDQRRAILLQTTTAIQQNVANSYAQLAVARAAISAGQNQVRAAQIAFDGTREEASLGARTTLDVLDAEQELLDARTTLISAGVDEFIAAYSVLAAIGSLTADSLNLPVQRYDPSVYYNLVKDAPVASRQGEDLNRVLRALGKQ